MKEQLVSVIVTTKNEEKNIEKCLVSIKNQSYQNIEIILVDNNSSDLTKEIGGRYGVRVYNKGPERSAQRNFGAKKSKGEFLVFIDADMILTKSVIAEAVELFKNKSSIGGIVIPEESIGEGYWSKVKAFERSFYIGDTSVEAPRFFQKSAFEKIGGYDDHLIAGEDWDLRNRISELRQIDRINSLILHNEGRLDVISILKKKFYYARFMHRYFEKYKSHSASTVRFFIFRSALYRKPYRLLFHPLLTIGMLILLLLESFAGFLGVIIGENEK